MAPDARDADLLHEVSALRHAVEKLAGVVENLAGLPEAVEQLAGAVAELASPTPRATPPALTVQVHDSDWEPPMLVAATGRRPATTTRPARPTIGEWLGLCLAWQLLPTGPPAARMENLFLRTLQPDYLDRYLDVLSDDDLEEALARAALTDDERQQTRALLAHAYDRALAEELVPHNPLRPEPDGPAPDPTAD